MLNKINLLLNHLDNKTQCLINDIIKNANYLDDVLEKHPNYKEQINKTIGKVKQFYLRWVVKQLDYNERIDEIISIIDAFERHKHKLKNKDLYSYEHLADLRSAIEESGKTKSEFKKEVKSTIDADELYESDNFMVIHLKNKEAAIYYGRGTQWCTAATVSHNEFNNYSKDNFLLYVIINKDFNKLLENLNIKDQNNKVEEKYRKIQIGYNKINYSNGENGIDSQIMDSLDQPVNESKLKLILGSEADVILQSINLHFNSKEESPLNEKFNPKNMSFEQFNQKLNSYSSINQKNEFMIEAISAKNTLSEIIEFIIEYHFKDIIKFDANVAIGAIETIKFTDKLFYLILGYINENNVNQFIDKSLIYPLQNNYSFKAKKYLDVLEKFDFMIEPFQDELARTSEDNNVLQKIYDNLSKNMKSRDQYSSHGIIVNSLINNKFISDELLSHILNNEDDYLYNITFLSNDKERHTVISREYIRFRNMLDLLKFNTTEISERYVLVVVNQLKKLIFICREESDNYRFIEYSLDYFYQKIVNSNFRFNKIFMLNIIEDIRQALLVNNINKPNIHKSVPNINEFINRMRERAQYYK